MSKFRYREVIDAIQWQPGIHIDGVQEACHDPGDGTTVSNGYGIWMSIVKVNPGDWIITHANGYRRPIGAKQFQIDYEPCE